MLPWIQLDTTTVPDGGVLKLMRRGSEFSIMLGSTELMNSRLSGSEEALADLACGQIGDRPRPAILIGGLGMGFTLRAALAVLTADARIVVAELVPAVIAWARGPLAELFGGSLEDARVEVQACDVGVLIGAEAGAYDAILLDVDNGPEGLTRDANDGLYSAAGLRAAKHALRAGGVLAVWSSEPAPQFTRRLRSAGFDVEEVKVRARKSGGGARHIVWMATKLASR